MTYESEYCISLTQDHIDRGTRLDSGRCAVALAVADTIGTGVRVGAIIRIGCGEHVYNYSEFVEKFIHDFDFGLPVDPIVFTIMEVNYA